MDVGLRAREVGLQSTALGGPLVARGDVVLAVAEHEEDGVARAREVARVGQEELQGGGVPQLREAAVEVRHDLREVLRGGETHRAEGGGEDAVPVPLALRGGGRGAADGALATRARLARRGRGLAHRIVANTRGRQDVRVHDDERRGWARVQRRARARRRVPRPRPPRVQTHTARTDNDNFEPSRAS